MAGVLEHAVAVVALQRHLHRPRRRPRLRILDGHLVVDDVVGDAREALRDLQRFAVPLAAAVDADARAVREVRRLDDERVAFEAAARVAEPHLDLEG